MKGQGRLYEDLPEADSAPSVDEQELSFEDAFSRLEDIVGRLEGGQASLEDSLRLFEEGVRLARFCRGRLDRAERRIRVLVEGEDGAEGKRLAVELEAEIAGGEDGMG